MKAGGTGLVGKFGHTEGLRKAEGPVSAERFGQADMFGFVGGMIKFLPGRMVIIVPICRL